MNSERYFDWLCQKVNPAARPYFMLLRQMFKTRFVPAICCPMDSNRAEDGQALRKEYITHASDYLSYKEAREDANILEVLVALCDDMEDVMAEPGDEHPETWFWTMILNLGLIKQRDSSYDRRFVERVLAHFLARDYETDGRGGLFPLRHPPSDQRYTDIWDQAMLYVNENERY